MPTDEKQSEYFKEYYEENKLRINRRRRILYHTSKAYRERIIGRQKEYDRRKAKENAEILGIIDAIISGSNGSSQTDQTLSEGSQVTSNKTIPRRRGRPRKNPISQNICSAPCNCDSELREDS